MDDLNFRTLPTAERSRKYIFANGTIEIKNVTRIAVRPSGTHRVEGDGGKYIIPSGWLAIQLDTDEWSF